LWIVDSSPGHQAPSGIVDLTLTLAVTLNVAGRHNVVLRATTEAIVRKLGDALVAPIVPFVAEGDIDPPTEHMRYPSTISVTEGTFRDLLSDICTGLRTHGFLRIVLIGAGTRGGTVGAGRVAVRQPQALAGQAIEMGRMEDRMAVAGEVAMAEVVGQDDQDAGPLRTRRHIGLGRDHSYRDGCEQGPHQFSVHRVSADRPPQPGVVRRTGQAA
jgi:hypothetical protein